MRKRYGRRTDHNQKHVVQMLQAVGAVVYSIEEPCDLLIGFRGKWILLEVKNKDGRNYGRQVLTQQQQNLAEVCEDKRLPFQVVYSGEEALACIGATS